MESHLKMIQSKRFSFFVAAGFFILIFFLALNPTTIPDTFYHVKAGETFFQHGLLYKDIFSSIASGRFWYPYEWFFEISIYLFQKTFGFSSLPFFVSTIVVAQVALLFFFCRKYFSLPLFFSFLLCFVYFALSSKLFVGRPQLLAILFFTFTFLSILWYTKTNKNLLWITLVTTYAWVNLHSSVIFAPYAFLSYSFICLVLYVQSKNLLWRKKAAMLFFYGILVGLVTILPPLGTLQYRLLLLFSAHFSEVSSFITEWSPLSRYSPFIQASYLGLIALAVVPFSALAIRKKKYSELLLALPLVPFLIAPYVSIRNTLFAYVCITLLWGWSLQYIFPTFSVTKKVLFFLSALALSFYASWVIYNNKLSNLTDYTYPTQAVDFLLQHHVNGTMFNDIVMGFYLIDKLYPKYNVFIDGRLDIYLCCEVPSYQAFTNLVANGSDKEVIRYFTNTFIQPHHVSFTILTPNNNTEDARLASLLSSDPSWELVFWDDKGVIFVRKDGKNNQILKEFGATAATPLGLIPVKNNELATAFTEYQRMISIADSAKSRNALGYIYLKQKNIDKAQAEFEKAIQLDPTFDSPYLNLGEIALSRNNIQEAISLYQKAQVLNPTRAFIYLRLSQLYLRYANDPQSAQAILQQGLSNAITSTDKQALTQQLQALQ